MKKLISHTLIATLLLAIVSALSCCSSDSHDSTAPLPASQWKATITGTWTSSVSSAGHVSITGENLDFSKSTTITLTLTPDGTGNYSSKSNYIYSNGVETDTETSCTFTWELALPDGNQPTPASLTLTVTSAPEGYFSIGQKLHADIEELKPNELTLSASNFTGATCFKRK